MMGPIKKFMLIAGLAAIGLYLWPLSIPAPDSEWSYKWAALLLMASAAVLGAVPTKQ